jgi:hypothetical protein
MSKGPRGEKSPVDVIGAAIIVAKVATSGIEEEKIKQKQESAPAEQSPRASGVGKDSSSRLAVS